MIFELQVHHPERPGSTENLRILFKSPEPALDGQAWACEVTWSGAVEGRVSIYGSTSFQALRLALEFIETEIPAALPGSGFLERGLPWPTPS